MPARLADQLLEAVVANGGVLPARAEQDVLREDNVRTPHQQVQHLELVRRQSHGHAAVKERLASGVESIRHLCRGEHAGLVVEAPTTARVTGQAVCKPSATLCGIRRSYCLGCLSAVRRGHAV